MATIRSYRDLIIWQKSIELLKEVYRFTEVFPKEEWYGLRAHTRKSAISVPSNIAEGFQRKSKKEHLRFLNIALGSLAELETQMIIAGELKYKSTEEVERLYDRSDHLSRMINKASLRFQGNPESENRATSYELRDTKNIQGGYLG
jgi:four helix bundle protein